MLTTCVRTWFFYRDHKNLYISPEARLDQNHMSTQPECMYYNETLYTRYTNSDNDDHDDNDDVPISTNSDNDYNNKLT